MLWRLSEEKQHVYLCTSHNKEVLIRFNLFLKKMANCLQMFNGVKLYFVSTPKQEAYQ